MSTTTTDTKKLFTDETSQSILDFWFNGVGPHPTQEQAMRWFRADEAFDSEIRHKFGSLLTTLTSQAPTTLTALASTPPRALSLLILLDQFPRNLYRGNLSAHIYATTDPLAVSLATHAIAHRLDRGPWEHLASRRMWFWLPFTHSEDLDLHRRMRVEFVEPLVAACKGGEDEYFVGMMGKSAVEHEDVVRRFGRYPHRNGVLGRESTAEEVAWLEDPGVGWAR